MSLRLLSASVALTLLACGPNSGSTASIFNLKSAGSGKDLMTHEAFSNAARWTYAIVDPDSMHENLADSYFEGGVVVHGVTCGRYITELQVVYLEQNTDGLYYWGSSDGDLRDAPFTLLSYPLRVGREWTTGDVETPGWYRYLVSAVEPIQTPAGAFDAARVDQLNTKTQERVSRWYVEDIGLVQRWGYSDLTGHVVSTTLVRFNREDTK